MRRVLLLMAIDYVKMLRRCVFGVIDFVDLSLETQKLPRLTRDVFRDRPNLDHVIWLKLHSVCYSGCAVLSVF